MTERDCRQGLEIGGDHKHDDMKRLVIYTEKEVVYAGDLPDGSGTWFHSGMYLAKEFDDETEEKIFRGLIESPPKLKEDMERFATAMGLTYSKSALKAELADTIDAYMKESNYPTKTEKEITR